MKDQHLYDEPLSELLTSSDDVMISWMKDFQLAIRDRDENFQVDRNEPNTLRAWLVPKRKIRSNEQHPDPKRIKYASDASQWNTNGTTESLRQGSWRPP